MQLCPSGELTIAALMQEGWLPRLRCLNDTTDAYAGAAGVPALRNLKAVYSGKGVFYPVVYCMNYLRATDGASLSQPVGLDVNLQTLNYAKGVYCKAMKIRPPVIFNLAYNNIEGGIIYETGDAMLFTVAHESTTALRVAVTVMGLEFLCVKQR